MGPETNPGTRIEAGSLEVGREEKDIQKELADVNEQINSVPEERRFEHFGKRTSDYIRKARGEELVSDGEHAPEKIQEFEKLDTLNAERTRLEEERNLYYKENPVEMVARLKELTKAVLLENMQKNRENRAIVTSEQDFRSHMSEADTASKHRRELETLRQIYDKNGWEEKDLSFLNEAKNEVLQELNRENKQESLQNASSYREQISPQTAEFMTNHILQQDLAYQDAELPKEQKEQMLNWSRTSESAKKYAESLANASSTGGLETVRVSARQMRDVMLSEASRLGIPVSPHGKSISWAMWDTGKQYHFFTHQDENGQGYEIGNPLESESKRKEIINRQLGWEAYAAFQNNPQYRTTVTGDQRYSAALPFFNKNPKASNNTLSSKDLAALGAALRGKQ